MVPVKRGCHGSDDQSVFVALCRIVEETMGLYLKEGKHLPAPTSGYDFVNTILQK